MSGAPAVVCQGVNHYFGEGEARKQILFSCEVSVGAGEVVVMTGPSGSGKSTLLTLIGGLRAVEEGSLKVLGEEMRGLPSERLVQMRRQVGFIFQAHNLFDSLSARENVMMGLDLLDLSAAEKKDRAEAMLERVGLAERMDYRPGSLSGGQRQRVAISRALAHGPRLVLADEPTAALDATIGRKIVDLFQEMTQGGCTVFMVTHDKRVLDAADRIVTMLDGAITSDVTTRRTLQLCEFLAGVPAFSALTPAALSEVSEHMVSRTLEEGVAVVRQGEEGDAFYLVAEGSVRVTSRDASGAEVELAVLGPGQFFGEAALLRGEPRNATVTTRSRSLLYALDKPDFNAALARSGDMKRQLLEVLFQRQ